MMEKNFAYAKFMIMTKNEQYGFANSTSSYHHRHSRNRKGLSCAIFYVSMSDALNERTSCINYYNAVQFVAKRFLLYFPKIFRKN